jgi:hypothetical protein
MARLVEGRLKETWFGVNADVEATKKVESSIRQRILEIFPMLESKELACSMTC